MSEEKLFAIKMGKVYTTNLKTEQNHLSIKKDTKFAKIQIYFKFSMDFEKLDSNN